MFSSKSESTPATAGMSKIRRRRRRNLVTNPAFGRTRYVVNLKLPKTVENIQ
jgi:hypothetical protein